MKKITTPIGIASLAIMVLLAYYWAFNWFGVFGLIMALFFTPITAILFMINLLFIFPLWAIGWIFFTIVLLTYQD